MNRSTESLECPTDSPVAENGGQRESPTLPSNQLAAPNAQSKTTLPGLDPAIADVLPYWVPPGVEMGDWSPELRARVAAVVNPAYREFVLVAKNEWAKSLGISLVFLLWLEVLDQIELAYPKPPDSKTQPLEFLGLVPKGESRNKFIERHLRLIGAKLKVHDLLLRVEKFSRYCQSKCQHDADDPYPNLSAFTRRARSDGKNEYC